MKTVLSVILLLVACNTGEHHQDFNLTPYKVSINGTALSKKEVVDFEKQLNETLRFQKEVYDKPDVVVHLESNGKTKEISFFTKEDYFYYGSYLDAWYDRMRGKSSPCYKLSKELLKIVESK